MIELTSGTITIDGLDITTIPRHHICSRLDAIGQEPFFLTGTVRFLDPYGSTSDESMVDAL
jgi:ATP-binding cassette subfamily C (CFTR/MRP) protein 1